MLSGKFRQKPIGTGLHRWFFQVIADAPSSGDDMVEMLWVESDVFFNMLFKHQSSDDRGYPLVNIQKAIENGHL